MFRQIGDILMGRKMDENQSLKMGEVFNMLRDKTVQLAVKSMAEVIEERVITDTELARVQGLLKEENPELSIKISELRETLRKMKQAC